MSGSACAAKIAEAFRAADARRTALDAALGACGAEDTRRDALWLELEETLAERRCCVRALAAGQASTLADAREKAAIARLLLQRQAEGAGEDPDLVCALARSALGDLLAFGTG